MCRLTLVCGGITNRPIRPATSQYLTLNDFVSNMQPRVGLSWDFTGEGRGKFFMNYARYVETPIPLDVNVRASGSEIQNDFNLNISRLNGAAGAVCVFIVRMFGNFGNLGNHATPFDAGLKPQSVNEWTAGVEYSPSGMRDLALGFRGIYRAQDEVIEDGSFDDGTTYFLFNPGRHGSGNNRAVGLRHAGYRLLWTCPPLLPRVGVRGYEAFLEQLSVHRFLRVLQPDR